MNIIDFLNAHYSKEEREACLFRNGRMNDEVSERLQKMGAIGSVSWTENGEVVTEYIYPEDAPPR